MNEDYSCPCRDIDPDNFITNEEVIELLKTKDSYKFKQEDYFRVYNCVHCGACGTHYERFLLKQKFLEDGNKIEGLSEQIETLEKFGTPFKHNKSRIKPLKSTNKNSKTLLYFGCFTTVKTPKYGENTAKYLLSKNITPNQISFFSFALSIVGALFFFLGGYANLLIGGMLAQISSIIDGCDGEIARLKFQTSEFGGWYDAVLDRYADAFLLFGLTYYVYFSGENLLYLFIGFLAIIGAFMNSYTADKYDGLMKRNLTPGTHYFRIGRDVRIGIIFIGTLINQPALVLFIIALLMNTENIRRILLFYKSK